ncbi:Serine/threonine-protein kinase AtPK2/AtPK19 [Vitis vinifera]|uniref:Serine/threonine-protein kinase AtPK2/AtPK19 n=1 Tax=Vitis vinifera TaxID=29760 RepID=A0A438EYG3_VITVI|nr:Serine/threonine-protein kinase AtPK2/AtPK19 [Vitis vinifera]
MIPSTPHKKTLHSILASKLKLTVPSPSSPDSLDFSDVFGPLTPHHHKSLTLFFIPFILITMLTAPLLPFKEDMVFQSEGSDKEGGDEVRKKGGPEISGDSDGIFAMKVMRKDTIISKNHMDYMKAERDILIKVEHPFIVSLRCSFQVIYSA